MKTNAYILITSLFLTVSAKAATYDELKAKWTKLANDHAPIVILHTDEPYYAMTVEEFRDNATKRSDRFSYGLCNQPSCVPTKLKGHRPNVKSVPFYVSIVPKLPFSKDSLNEPGSTVDIVYWFFYGYSKGKYVGAWWWPYDKAYYGNHVGDWEHMTIRFKNDKPSRVYLSQHASGHEYAWADPKIAYEHAADGTLHPRIYSALGSHAVYERTGDVKYASYGGKPFRVDLIDKMNNGMRWVGKDNLVVAFPKINSNKLKWDEFWMSYPGRWGDHESACVKLAGKPLGFCKLEHGPTGPNQKRSTDPSYGAMN